MVVTKYWVMAKKYHGAPKPSDFELKQDELPQIKDGGMIYHHLTAVINTFLTMNSRQKISSAAFFSLQVQQV